MHSIGKYLLVEVGPDRFVRWRQLRLTKDQVRIIKDVRDPCSLRIVSLTVMTCDEVLG